MRVIVIRNDQPADKAGTQDIPRDLPDTLRSLVIEDDNRERFVIRNAGAEHRSAGGAVVASLYFAGQIEQGNDLPP